MPSEMTDEQLETYQELLDLVVYTADSGFNTLYGEVIDLELSSKIRKAIRQIEDLMDYEMKPLIFKLEGLEKEEDEILNPLSLPQYREPPKSFAEAHVFVANKITTPSSVKDLELIKEEPIKDNTYTISYKQEVGNEWVLVSKTGHSDNEEVNDIVRELLTGEIPEELLSVLIWSSDLTKEMRELLEEGKRGVDE